MTGSSESVTIADALGIVLQRRFRQDLYQELTEGLAAGLDQSTYPVISCIDRIGPATSAEVGREIGLDRSVVSRRAKELVSAGLLEPRRLDSDARVIRLALSREGQRTIRTMRDRLEAAVGRHVASWTPDDRESFARLFARFATAGALAPATPD